MPLTENALSFLFENRVMDIKSWFLEHKAEYDALVLQPLRELVSALTPALLAIDPLLICEPKVGRSISRIYRDTRFSHDKSIFRDVMWCLFIREKKLYNGLPGFFFEFSPRGFRYGCGYYQASSAAMDAMRAMIVGGEPAFKAALHAFSKQSVFHLEDSRYKRSRHPDQPEDRREWLDQRNLCFIADSEDFDLLFSDALSDRLAQDFALLAPMYAFMMSAEARLPRAEAIMR